MRSRWRTTENRCDILQAANQLSPDTDFQTNNTIRHGRKEGLHPSFERDLYEQTLSVALLCIVL